MRAIINGTIAGAMLALSSTLSPAASANSVDSNTVRLGMYFVMYDTKGTDLAGPFTPPGLSSSLRDVQTPYLAYVRRLSPHFELEAAFGVPPKTTAIAKGPATVGSVPFNGQEVLTARWLSPSVLLNYKFGDESRRLRPYVGVGMNYTVFIDRRSTAAGDAISGGPTRVDLSNSTGIAGDLGLQWKAQDHWSAILSFSASKVESNLTATTGGVVRTSHINFHPSTVVLAMGYSF